MCPPYKGRNRILYCREGRFTRITKYLKHTTNRATPLPWTQHQDWETTRATNKVSSRLSVHFSNTGLEWVYLTMRLQFLQGIETRTLVNAWYLMHIDIMPEPQLTACTSSGSRSSSSALTYSQSPAWCQSYTGCRTLPCERARSGSFPSASFACGFFFRHGFQSAHNGGCAQGPMCAGCQVTLSTCWGFHPLPAEISGCPVRSDCWKTHTEKRSRAIDVLDIPKSFKFHQISNFGIKVGWILSSLWSSTWWRIQGEFYRLGVLRDCRIHAFRLLSRSFSWALTCST